MQNRINFTKYLFNRYNIENIDTDIVDDCWIITCKSREDTPGELGTLTVTIKDIYENDRELIESKFSKTKNYSGKHTTENKVFYYFTK